MKNLKKILREYAAKAVVATGLGLGVSGCQDTFLNPDSLPADNPRFGMQTVLFEEDLKDSTTAPELFNYTITNEDGRPTGSIIFPVKDTYGKESPFDVTYQGKTNSDGSSNWHLSFKDNTREFYDGEIWGVEISGTAEGEWALLRKPKETVYVTYMKGHSNKWLTDHLTPTSTEKNLEEKLAEWACPNLPQADNADIRFYFVGISGASGNEEFENLIPQPGILQLDAFSDNASAPGNSYNHMFSTGDYTNGRIVAVKGKIPENFDRIKSGLGGAFYDRGKCANAIVLPKNIPDVTSAISVLDGTGDSIVAEEFRGIGEIPPSYDPFLPSGFETEYNFIKSNK